MHECHRVCDPRLEIGKGFLRVVMFRHFHTREAHYVIASDGEATVVPGMTPLERGQLMTDEMYLEAIEQYGDEFDARMGAEAVREMLSTTSQLR